MNCRSKLSFLLIVLVMSQSLWAQKVMPVPIPRDTSFTPYQAWLKLRKEFPQAKIVVPQLPVGVSSSDNVVYATLPDSPYEKRALHLDLFSPEKKGKYPALLLIHGGGWRSGNRTMQAPMAQQIAAKGYVTACVEYRLSPEAIYPAAVHDIKAAVRFLRANAARFDIDPDKIAITGSSAGGQLAALIGMTGGLKKFEGEEGNNSVSSRVQAIIDMDGILDFTDPNESAKDENPANPSAGASWFGATFENAPEKWVEASPIIYASKTTPPILFINSVLPRFHAGRDSTIAMLKKLGIYTEVHTIPGTPHPFWLFHPWFSPTVEYMVSFLDRILKNTANPDKSEVVVAQDGSGDFASIQKAIDASKAFPDKRTTIFVKNGVYHEKLLVPAFNTKLSIVGESVEKTIISFGDFFDKVNRGRNSTFYTATLDVEGNDFSMENLTVENSAGAVGQAIAISITGDRCVFRNCRFLGNQDTVYAAGQFSRMLFTNCFIEGTTDFIFGEATVLFEKCEIHCKGDSYITAASTPEGKPFGFVFSDCKITAADGIKKVYLGRPWRIYARVAFLNCEFGAFICPEGWHNWNKPESEKTTAFAEYKNIGSGASVNHRVNWSRQLSAEEASAYLPENILGDWVSKYK